MLWENFPIYWSYSPFCVQAKIIKLVGLKNGGRLSPINLVTFAGTQNGEYRLSFQRRIFALFHLHKSVVNFESSQSEFSTLLCKWNMAIIRLWKEFSDYLILAMNCIWFRSIQIKAIIAILDWTFGPIVLEFWDIEIWVQFRIVIIKHTWPNFLFKKKLIFFHLFIFCLKDSAHWQWLSSHYCIFAVFFYCKFFNFEF